MPTRSLRVPGGCYYCSAWVSEYPAEAWSPTTYRTACCSHWPALQDCCNYYNNKPYVQVPAYALGITSGFVYFTKASGNKTIFYLSNQDTGESGCEIWLFIFMNFSVTARDESAVRSAWDPGSDRQYDKWNLDRRTAFLAFMLTTLGVAYSLMSPYGVGALRVCCSGSVCTGLGPSGKTHVFCLFGAYLCNRCLY